MAGNDIVHVYTVHCTRLPTFAEMNLMEQFGSVCAEMLNFPCLLGEKRKCMTDIW